MEAVAVLCSAQNLLCRAGMSEPSAEHVTRDVLRAQRWRLFLTYATTLVENLFSLLYPFATGHAVDGLLAGRSALSALWPLALVWTLHVVVGALRQVYDTRVFSSIYAEIATATVMRQRAAEVSTGEIAARATMARELVTFFETELPMLATAAIGLLGSVAMLFFYDLRSGLIVALLIAPVTLVYRGFNRRAQAFNRALNDEAELEVSLIEAGAHAPLAAHFRQYSALRTRLSTSEATSWSVVELFSIVAVMTLLVHATSLPDIAAGQLYAMLAYVWRVLESLEQAPLLVQRVGRLFDIRRRLELTSSV